MPVPESANAIQRWSDDARFGTGRCLRLGHGEFLLEQDDGDALREQVRAALAQASGGAWIVQRADHALLLDGPPWPAELARVCAFDFEQLRRDPDRVVMTLLADVSVTLAREPTAAPGAAGAMPLRLWCDPGYATYLHECLHTLAADHSGLTGDSR